MLQHRFLDQDFVEPTGQELRDLIDEREVRWLELVGAGAGDLEWIESGGGWHSSPLRLDDPELGPDLAICVTPWANVQLARILGVRLATVDEAVALLKSRPHVDPVKVTFPGGHPLAFQTSASNEAIRMHSDALREIDGFNPNAGKWWADPDGDGPLDGLDQPVNVGWADPGAPYTFQGLRMWQTPGKAHNVLHVDCSQVAKFFAKARPEGRPSLRDVADIVPDDGPLWRLPAFALHLRTCVWIGAQFGLGVRELPGAQHDPRILAYSRFCARGGRLLGVREDGSPIWTEDAVPLRLYRDEDPWCAATASESLRVSMFHDDDPPHGLRVAVRELVEDAGGSLIASRKGWANSWRDIGYSPKPGDLAIYGRNGQSPRRGGQGHVRIVTQTRGSRYHGFGGNEGNRVSVGWRDLVDPALEGWIAR